MSILRLLILAIALLSITTGCSLPRVSAEDRLFLNVSLDFLGEYSLPDDAVAGSPTGGISGITYDRRSNRFYAVSDDRSDRAPARFYTLQLNLDTRNPQMPGLASVAVENITTLTAEDGNPYTRGTIDPEGIALSPRNTVYISSEGATDRGIAPFIDEFDLETGRWQTRLPIPARFMPKQEAGETRGIENNRGFEALTLNIPGFTPDGSLLEPFRLFAATEAPLIQDLPPIPAVQAPDESAVQLSSPKSEPWTLAAVVPTPIRLLHYLIGDDLPTLLAEHLYVLDPVPESATYPGLTELLVLDQGGHFLSLERYRDAAGYHDRLYQFVIGAATDTSGYTALQGDVAGIQPVRKRLLLDFKDLDITPGNLEGMALGPRLPDGSTSLLLVSDNHFNSSQPTQFLLFRLKSARPFT